MANNIIKKEDVTYDAILLNEESVEKLTKLCKDNNLDISEPQANMHMTLSFYDSKEISNLSKAIKKADEIEKENLQKQLNEILEEKSKIQLNNKELGTNVVLDATELGVYYKDGKLMNVGVRINERYFSDIDLGCGRRMEDIFSLEIPHITIYINTEEKAKAVNTPKCFGVGLEEGETFEVIKFEKNIELMGDATAFKYNLTTTELEGFPLNPEKHSEMSKEEVEKANNFYDELKQQFENSKSDYSF